MLKSTNLKKLFIGVFLIVGIYSCDDPNLGNNAVIKGDIKNPKSGKIYLIDVAKKDIIKDSTTITNGKFIFKLESKLSFSSFEAALFLWRDDKGIKALLPIGIINPYRKNFIESTFFVDRGVTVISNVDSTDFFKIEGSKQNEPSYRKLLFGSLNKNQKATERNNVIDADLKLIKEYPYSFYLLNLLYLNRELFTIDELDMLTTAFNSEGKSWAQYSKLRNWMAYKKGKKTILSNIVLENEKGGQGYIFDIDAKINMLVFWASWCGPCRSEIPLLKELYQKYHNRGLSITSISIDNSQNRWKEALSIENMPWKQLIANDSTKNTFDLNYNISSIPVIVLVNKNGELIQRFVGTLSKEQYNKTLSILDENR